MFYGWDVVNEAISDATGTYRTDSENSEPLSNDTHGSNSSWWHVYGSNEYIINAFKFANKYAPETLELYYNDYNETVIKKMNGIKELLQTIKDLEGERGVGTRITAMGLQGHYQMEDPNANSLEVAMKEYGKIVGEVQITELDLRASSDYDGSDEANVSIFDGGMGIILTGQKRGETKTSMIHIKDVAKCNSLSVIAGIRAVATKKWNRAGVFTP
mgnify:CR=1 FL=1